MKLHFVGAMPNIGKNMRSIDSFRFCHWITQIIWVVPPRVSGLSFLLLLPQLNHGSNKTYNLPHCLPHSHCSTTANIYRLQWQAHWWALLYIIWFNIYNIYEIVAVIIYIFLRLHRSSGVEQKCEHTQRWQNPWFSQILEFIAQLILVIIIIKIYGFFIT